MIVDTLKVRLAARFSTHLYENLMVRKPFSKCTPITNDFVRYRPNPLGLGKKPTPSGLTEQVYKLSFRGLMSGTY